MGAGQPAQNRIPDPVDYLEMRRATFGSDLTMSLCRLGHGRRLPPEVYRSGPVRSLENAAIDYACLINDVFSYQKEIEYEGEVHNAILVVQNFFGCDYPTALGIVHDLMTQRHAAVPACRRARTPVALRGLRSRRGRKGRSTPMCTSWRTGWPAS